MFPGTPAFLIAVAFAVLATVSGCRSTMVHLPAKPSALREIDTVAVVRTDAPVQVSVLTSNPGTRRELGRVFGLLGAIAAAYADNSTSNVETRRLLQCLDGRQNALSRDFGNAVAQHLARGGYSPTTVPVDRPNPADLLDSIAAVPSNASGVLDVVIEEIRVMGGETHAEFHPSITARARLWNRKTGKILFATRLNSPPTGDDSDGAGLRNMHKRAPFASLAEACHDPDRTAAVLATHLDWIAGRIANQLSKAGATSLARQGN